MTRIGRLQTWAAVAGLAALLGAPDSSLAQPGGRGGFGGGGTGTSSANRQQYYSNGMVGEAMISVDPETRRVIVISDEETNEHIKQVIESLDQPKPQVLIKVVFMEVTHRDNSDIGIEGMFDHTFNGGSDSGAASTMFGPAGQLIGSAGTGGLYTLTTSDFTATLRAIKEAGETEILSRPSILTRNNQEAVILIGQEVPFVTNSRTDTLGNIINTVQYDDVGIILRVTPFISEDGLVEMIVAPEISSVGEQTVPISGSADAPVINKRSAETVVVTAHGQTVVIGGLMENNKVETTRKVPILGDIPLLGLPFRRRIKEDVKTELLIFVTPYVVQTPRAIAELNADEMKRTRLSPKTFKRADLDKFVEDIEIKAKDDPKKRGKTAEAKKAEAAPDKK